MPNRRLMEREELQMFIIKRHLTMPIEEVTRRLDSGAKLEMVESSLSETSDYCKVLLDGNQIAYIPGY